MGNNTITSILIKFCCDEYFSDVLLLVNANLMKLKYFAGFHSEGGWNFPPPSNLEV